MSQLKSVTFKDEARSKIKKGLNTLADAVKVTLGPKGRNVILEKDFGSPVITKDGVSVAKEINLPDKLENLGAQIVKEVASKTNDIAGDGTTTATVLAQSIFNAGYKSVTSGSNPMDLKKGIEYAVNDVIDRLSSITKQIANSNEIQQVATVSANNDSGIGQLISEAMQKVGKDGIISVDDSHTTETTMDIVEGMQFDRGYINPNFVTDAEKMEVNFDDGYILLTDKKISSIKEIMQIIEKIAQQGKSLLLVADDFENEVLMTLVVNKLRGSLRVCAVKAPGFGERRREILEDIAILTGGEVVTDDKGMSFDKLNLDSLGRAKKINITKDDTLIVEGKGKQEALQARIKELRARIENANSDYEKEKLQERLARLNGGVAVLRVGATTEIEAKEKKDRIEDAVNATRAAIEEGIIPGGGTAFVRISNSLRNGTDSNISLCVNEDQRRGYRVILDALEEPLRNIVSNAGLEGTVIINKILEKDSIEWGYDANAEEYCNLIKKGIIDPTKVARVALENAASVASLLLTTEATVTILPEDNKNEEISGNHIGM